MGRSSLHFIDWFAGIGGFRLGLEMAGGFDCVAYSEIDDYACRVYEKHWPGTPNLGDITRLKAEQIPSADCWTGGFPCQPHSIAGKRLGADDERDLWPAWARLIRLVRPRYVLLENVPGILAGAEPYFLRVLGDLAACGYDAEWATIGACAVGAPHHRHRLWCWAWNVADRQLPRLEGWLQRRDGAGEWATGACCLDWSIDPADVVADAEAGAERAGLCKSEPTDQRRGRHGNGRCPFCGGDQDATGRGRVGVSSADVENAARDLRAEQAQGGAERERAGAAGQPDVADAAHKRKWAKPTLSREGLRTKHNREIGCCPFCGGDQDATGDGAAQLLGDVVDGLPAGLGVPFVGRVCKGEPHRIAKLRALGNAVVPQVVAWIGQRIRESIDGPQ